MKKFYTAFGILFCLLYTTGMQAQTASITWPLTATINPNAPIGNIQGTTEIIGGGTSVPYMVIHGYSIGQELWVGNTGGTWVPNDPNNPTLDPGRYIEFKASPVPGNTFFVSNISFNYGDVPLSTDFNILSFQASYSTDNWAHSTLMNPTPLVYLNTAMLPFSQPINNVVIQSGQTFSLRIYPYPIQHGLAMTPTYAIHNSVVISGSTKPEVSKTGSIGGTKFNDLNGNGVKDPGEPGLPNWHISLNLMSVPYALTDSLGNYHFYNLPAGTYTVSEVNQTGWVQTAPAAPGTYTVALAGGQNLDTLNFGNRRDSCRTKAWSPLGVGTNGEVWALAVIGTDLYAGGLFTTAGGITVNHIAKWNGSAWSALIGGNGINGINGAVTSLAVIGSDLYAGGWFTSAGGIPALNIAKWDGTNWTALGSGLSAAGAIQALAVMGTKLYATSYILDPALGGPANLIAQWDANTSAWSPFSVMDDYVNAMMVDGTDLYAGGQFTLAGGVSANKIAKWNGTVWSPLGSGTDYFIGGTGLEMMAGKLFVGGRFLVAGGNTANYIAEWDGSAWSSFGSGSNIGMNNEVEGLAVMGTDLYASGSFTTAEGVMANSVAKWDGTNWSPLGSGMNDGVWRLAVIGSDLYAGGIFTTAGGAGANYIAKYSCAAATSVDDGASGDASPKHFQLEQNYPNPFNPSTKIEYRLEKAAQVSLRVYNSLGEEVATLVNGRQEAGSYTVPFSAGKGTLDLSSGVYFYRLEAGSFVSTKKFILMK